MQDIFEMENKIFDYDKLSKRSAKYFVKKKQVLGYSYGYLVYIPYKVSLRIYSVGVLEEYRGKGIGKLLILEAEAKAESLSKTKVSLECKRDLVSFYTKLGYKVTKVLTKYYDDGSEGYKMEKKI